jgi:hypothetical protein
MLSDRKVILRLAELIAVTSTLTAFWMAVHTYRVLDADFPVSLWGTAGMAALMLTFLPACMLGGEYVKTVKKPVTYRQRTEGLSPAEISTLLHWAPTSYKAAAAAGVLVAAGAALKYGSIEFHSSEPIDAEKVPGMFLYLAAFFLLALPVLGSAARMPGTYAANSEA